MLTSTYINVLFLRSHVVAVLTGRRDDDRGASLVEYAFLVGLIAIACIAAVTLLGSANSASADASASSIAAAN